MRRIIYAGTELVTGDEIAQTLLRLSEALARLGSAETVSIPILNADGSLGTASLLVGPSSQIVTLDAGDHLDELVDPTALGELRDRITSLVSSGSERDDSPDARDLLEDL